MVSWMLSLTTSGGETAVCAGELAGSSVTSAVNATTEFLMRRIMRLTIGWRSKGRTSVAWGLALTIRQNRGFRRLGLTTRYLVADYGRFCPRAASAVFMPSAAGLSGFRRSALATL